MEGVWSRKYLNENSSIRSQTYDVWLNAVVSESIILTERSNGWTLVAISNDKYLARQCDQVIIIENGKINNSSNSL